MIIFAVNVTSVPLHIGFLSGVIEIEGPIYESNTVVNQLKSYTKNPLIKGILLRIDSPGGGVSASQEIYSEVKYAKAKGKTIVVVTHDKNLALKHAKEIYWIKDGKVEKIRRY